ncbi:hypothetical protein DM75_3448 [Burkholderia mallei]|nr:hypothetical protein DM75_3448 [Burkholderia mallei]
MRGGRAALRKRAPEARGAREPHPLRAIVRRERGRAHEQRARFVVAALPQPQQPKAAERVRIARARGRGTREERLGGRRIAARKRLQAALLRDVVRIAREAKPRVALLLERGGVAAKLVVLGCERQIGAQCVEIREVAPGRLQHAAPQRERGAPVRIRPRDERPREPVRLRARVVALVQQLREHRRRVGVRRIGGDGPAQRVDRARAAIGRARDDLVILGAERARRRAVREQRDDAAGRFVTAPAAREQPNLRHLLAAARRDAVFVVDLARRERAGRRLLQAFERRARALRVADAQQDPRVLGEQRRIARRDQQRLAQRVAREVVAMLVRPHARRRVQRAHGISVGRVRRRDGLRRRRRATRRRGHEADRRRLLRRHGRHERHRIRRRERAKRGRREAGRRERQRRRGRARERRGRRRVTMRRVRRHRACLRGRRIERRARHRRRPNRRRLRHRGGLRRHGRRHRFDIRRSRIDRRARSRLKPRRRRSRHRPSPRRRGRRHRLDIRRSRIDRRTRSRFKPRRRRSRHRGGLRRRGRRHRLDIRRSRIDRRARSRLKPRRRRSRHRGGPRRRGRRHRFDIRLHRARRRIRARRHEPRRRRRRLHRNRPSGRGRAHTGASVRIGERSFRCRPPRSNVVRRGGREAWHGERDRRDGRDPGAARAAPRAPPRLRPRRQRAGVEHGSLHRTRSVPSAANR